MDGARFDRLAKRLAAGGTSRRRVLRGLGGGLLGAVLSGRGVDEVAAAASHLCCTYQCGETFTTSCSRHGSCPPPPVGCTTLDSAYYVRRCKDCAPQVPTATTTTTPAPTTTTTTTAAPTTTTTTTTPAPTTTTTTTTTSGCRSANASCTFDADCCSNACAFPAPVGVCCPTCPSGCTCFLAFGSGEALCTDFGGSHTNCSDSSACPTGEACAAGTCSTVCPT